MNILHVINAYSPIFGCGPADRCQKMAEFLVQKGHTVTILTSNHSWDSDYANSTPGVEIISFPYFGGRFCYTPSISKFLKKRIHEFDVVHLMNHWTYQNIVVYKAVKKAGIPFVFSAMGALPIVYRSFFIKRIYNLIYGYRIMKNASTLIGITEDECNQYKKYNRNKNLIHYLPNAISENEYFRSIKAGNFKKKFNLDEEKKIILFLGRISHIKGPDILLEGFINNKSLTSNSILVFVGPDYGMESSLKQKVKEMNLTSIVSFCGPLTGTEKLEAYVDADVFVVPSRQENMSIVAVESCALGTPTVITDVCGFNDIGKSKAGYVVPVNSKRIANAISKIVEDKEIREDMSINALEMVKSKYTWSSIGKKMEFILENIKNKKKYKKCAE
jgi:glycosyltransferase involved in cell wall biosynthesis